MDTKLIFFLAAQHLPREDLPNLFLTNKALAKLSSDDFFWMSKFENDYPEFFELWKTEWDKNKNNKHYQHLYIYEGWKGRYYSIDYLQKKYNKWLTRLNNVLEKYR